MSLPPGRTKQDVANLVDLALSDSLVDGDRYDYDILVEKLRGNGLALVALTSSPSIGDLSSAAGAAPLEPKQATPAALSDDDVVTVCSACLRACCWQGTFMCDAADMAGTVDKTVRELRAGRHGEHEDYWRKK